MDEASPLLSPSGHADDVLVPGGGSVAVSQNRFRGSSVQDLLDQPDIEPDVWPGTGPDHPPPTNEAIRRAIWTRVRYYVPVIGWLPSYSIRDNLQGDCIAGLTVACLLIPQALSYAQALVNIPPVYGLYTCFVPLIVYSLLGTSRQLGVGPEALVSILVGAAIKEKSGLNKPAGGGGGGGGGSPEALAAAGADTIAENIAIANLMALMVGLFTFLLGFFRLGFLDSVLSRALLRGFVTAVAVVVMIDLSGGLLGIPPRADAEEGHVSPIELLFSTFERIGETHVPTAIISAVSVAFLAGMRALKLVYKGDRRLQLVPEILLLVVASTVLCGVFRWDEYGVEILKEVKGGLIYPKLPQITVGKLRYYLLSAILISVIGFVESIVVAKTYATKHNYNISPNRELVALGAANVFGSLFGAWPAFGSLGRSAVNDGTGARTQVAGFVTGIVVLVAIVALLPWFYFLPKAVCSAIIVVAATKLIELHDIYFIFNLRAWKDLGLLMMTFVTTLVISIEVGTLISVGTSLLLVIKHTTKSRIAILGRTLVVDPKTNQVKTKFRSITDSAQVQPIEGALVIRIEEGLFFGNTGQLKDRLNRVEMYGELGVHPGEAPRTRNGNGNGNGNGSGLAGRVDSLSNFSTGEERMEVLEAQKGLGREPIHSVIFDIGAVTDIDASATQNLVEIVESYRARGIQICFVKLRETCRPWFHRSGLIALVGVNHFFDKIVDAIDYLRDHDRMPIVDPPPATAEEILSRGSATSLGNTPTLEWFDRNAAPRMTPRGGGVDAAPPSFQ
ncbi:Solute carrier 26, partial [Irineochytrium annulatum]